MNRAGLFALAGTALTVAAASFLFARVWLEDEGAAAAQDDASRAQSKAIVTIEGQIIDTSQADWYVPLLDADSRQIRSEKQIAGIRIGPDVRPDTAGVCAPGEAKYIESARAQESALAISPSYLPPDAMQESAQAIECRGQVVSHTITYNIPPEQGLDGRLQRGELNWFDAQHGGTFTISKAVRRTGAISSSIPDHRWSQRSVLGRESAFAKAVLGELGDSAIVSFDGTVQTAIRGTFVADDELMAIAEGLQ